MRVYVPGVVVVGLAIEDVKLPGPVQLKVVLELGELPFSVTTGLLQPIVPPVALAPGGVLFRLTTAVAVALQLLLKLVIVTV